MLTVDRAAVTDVRMVRQLMAGNTQSTVVVAMDRDVLASIVMFLSSKNRKKECQNYKCPRVKRIPDILMSKS